LKKQQIKPAESYIRKFSDAVYPENPEDAALDLLQSLWPMMFDGVLTRDKFQRLANTVLSGPMADLVPF